MTPDEEDRLARSRFTMLTVMKAGGVVMMLLGLWIWHGDIVREGGHWTIGMILFTLGFVDSLILPRYLVSRWRTPPRP